MVDVIKNIGENVQAGVTVKNTGTSTGTWTFSFAIEGTVGYGGTEYKNVTLNPGQSQILSWNFPAPNVPGSSGQYVIYWDSGTKFYPQVLTNSHATSYFMTIIGIPQLEITDAILG